MMCGCHCCQNRCSSTFVRPGWGSTVGTWCGCTCANCIRAFAEAAYERGEQRYATEVRELRAAIQRVREVCEQEVKDRRLWFTDDRHPFTLDHIDAWNDALDLVEQALDRGAE